MPGDPYLDLRKRVQRRMEARLALAEGEVNAERSLRQIESALGLPRGYVNDREALTEILEEQFAEVLLAERVRLSDYERQRLFRLVVGDMLGLGPLDGLLEDPGVSAVFVLDTRAVYVERGGRLVPGQVTFDDAQQLDKITRRIFAPMGYRVGEGAGLATGHLPDGSRVDAVLAPDASPDGAQLVIRRRPDVPPALEALVEAGVLPGEVASFLRSGLVARCNMLVAGKPRSGKTTLLAALADSLPAEARLVVVERALEMPVTRENVVRLESQSQQGAAYSVEALLRGAPELLPDWVWLGEVTAEVARTYVEMLARVGLCAALTLRDPEGPPALGMSPRQALDRLVALVSEAHPLLLSQAVEQQIIAGLGVLVLMGEDSGGSPLVSEVALVGREETGLRVESVYDARDGSTEDIAAVTRDLLAQAAMFAAHRTGPAAQPRALAQPLFADDGSLADPTLDEVYFVAGGLVIGLREEEGTLVSADLTDAQGDIRRLTQAAAEDALLWAEERPDGTRVALARPPVSVGGVALSLERFAARPGGLKRMADLGMLTPDVGNLLVKALWSGQGMLLCGPTGSGKWALMRSLLKVLPDAPDCQVIESLDASTLPTLLSAGGQAKALAALDCADGVDPLAALSAWQAVWPGEGQPATLPTLAGPFDLLVRMGRVGGRQRMILGVDQIIAGADGYRLEPLFVARPGEDRRLGLVQVGQPTF